MGIEIPDDELIPDEELAKLWGTTTRSLRERDKLPDGLPYVFLGGKKYRLKRGSGEWLARQVMHPNPRRRGREETKKQGASR